MIWIQKNSHQLNLVFLPKLLQCKPKTSLMVKWTEKEKVSMVQKQENAFFLLMI